MPADDLTDPAPATTFAHLDATTVLSRGIAELGIYPAVDPLDSTSRIMDPNVVGQEHYDVARGVQKILQVGFALIYYFNVNSLSKFSKILKPLFSFNHIVPLALGKCKAEHILDITLAF